MVRTNRRRVFIGIGFLVALPPVVAMGFNYSLFGAPWPLSHHDELTAPQRVVSWDHSGLRLVDGRVLLPASMSALPVTSKIIPALTKQGIEIDNNGRIFGLIRVWHNCGNDALRDDVSRMDLAQVLAYYGEGKTSLVPNKKSQYPFEESKYGWSVSERNGVRRAFDPKFAFMREDYKSSP